MHKNPAMSNFSVPYHCYLSISFGSLSFYWYEMDEQQGKEEKVLHRNFFYFISFLLLFQYSALKWMI